LKRSILFFLVLSYAFSSFAQDQVSKSKIKLVDGSELEVLILENVPGKYIKIKLPGNEVVEIKYDKIASIKHSSFKYHGNFKLKEGFHMAGSFSLLFGRASQYSEARVGLAMAITTNYRFNHLFSLGLGIEPTALFLNGENLMLPVYARIKGNFRENRVSAIYMLDAGWAFVGNNGAFESTVEGGWLLRPSAGARFNKFSLTVGYQVQEITTTTTQPWIGNDFISIEKRVMKNVVISTRLNF
jgi:hypothetical protein